MIRAFFFSVEKQLVIVLLVFSLPIRAQQLLSISISSLGNARSNEVWVSQPMLYHFHSVCLSLNMGISLHLTEKREGYFVINCLVIDSLSGIDFTLYPNPVLSQATLTFSTIGIRDQRFQLQIFDALGRLVHLDKVYGNELYSGHMLELEQLSSGTYFLVVRNESLQKTIRFIKL